MTGVAGIRTRGLRVEGGRSAGCFQLWGGPTDPVLSLYGLVLASEGPRLRWRWGKRKRCSRRRRWERGLLPSILKRPSEGKRKSAGLSDDPCLPGGTWTQRGEVTLLLARKAQGVWPSLCLDRAGLTSYRKSSLTSPFRSHRMLFIHPHYSPSLQNLLVCL